MPIKTAFTKLVEKTHADQWAEDMVGQKICLENKYGSTEMRSNFTIHFQVLNPQDYSFQCTGEMVGARKNKDGSHDIDVRIIK